MGSFRCSAEGIVGIASENAAVYRAVNTDGSDDIVVNVPAGVVGEAQVVPYEAGNVLLIRGQSADIHGGVSFQVGSLHGGVHGSGTNQMIEVLVPPGRNPHAINWAG